MKSEIEKEELNGFDLFLYFIDTANEKRTSCTLLGKSSKKYNVTSLIYPNKNGLRKKVMNRILSKNRKTVIQHLRTFTEDGCFIRLLITEYMKKGIKFKMEIYQSREIKNQKGEHMNIIFEFEKPAAISKTGTVPVNTATVIINKENRITVVDKGDRVFDYFLKLYVNDDIKFRDISQLLIFEMFKPDIIKNVCSMNVKGNAVK
jgi:hypothetical protein